MIFWEQYNSTLVYSLSTGVNCVPVRNVSYLAPRISCLLVCTARHVIDQAFRPGLMYTPTQITDLYWSEFVPVSCNNPLRNNQRLLSDQCKLDSGCV